MKTDHIQVTAQQSRFHSATLDATTSNEFDLHDVTLTVGDKDLLTSARVYLKADTKYALIGRNGSGKSTLLQAVGEKLIPGIPPSIRIVHVTQTEEDGARDEQDPDTSVVDHVLGAHTEYKELSEERDVLEKAMEAGEPIESQRILNVILLKRAEQTYVEARLVALRRSGTRGKQAREEEIAAEGARDMAKARLDANEIHPQHMVEILSLLSDIQLSLELMDAATMTAKVDEILKGLGFGQVMIDGPYSALSGGWRSRCRLALALLVPSDILLLDEPSNFMDLESILWLQHCLSSLPQTVVLISHDQFFINAVADETIALKHQGLKYFPGTPSAMAEAEAEERQGQLKQQAALDKKKAHIEASIAEGQRTAKKTGDENRLRMVKARTKKLNDRWGNETSAKGTRYKWSRDYGGYHFSKRRDIEIEALEPQVKMRFNNAAEVKVKGNLIDLDNVSVAYGKNVILEGLSLTIGQGDRVALVGKNGQGKSTLARLIIGEIGAMRGTVYRHPELKIGYFDQHSVESLPTEGEMTSLQLFSQRFANDPAVGSEAHARMSLARVGLVGQLASHTTISLLSGGQKVRLALCLLFEDPPNFIVLDEVTTHLDFATLQAMAGELKRWKGGLLLVTHDRYFCNVLMGAISLDSDDSDVSSSDYASTTPPRVYHVRKKGIKLLERGMEQYEEIIERKLARQSS